jgi:hypothetical protein
MPSTTKFVDSEGNLAERPALPSKAPKIIGPSAVEILTAVHRPSQEQRQRLRRLPTTAAAVLVTLASAPLVTTVTTATRGPSANDENGQPSLLVWPAYIANVLGITEGTVKGHLKSLVEAGLATGHSTVFGPAYAANGSVVLANVGRQR